MEGKIGKKRRQMSFTCSSNHVHNSADNFGSFATELGSPTRAQGMRYYNKHGVRQSVGTIAQVKTYLAVQLSSFR